jgi:hypothetical protein
LRLAYPSGQTARKRSWPLTAAFPASRLRPRRCLCPCAPDWPCPSSGRRRIWSRYSPASDSSAASSRFSIVSPRLSLGVEHEDARHVSAPLQVRGEAPRHRAPVGRHQHEVVRLAPGQEVRVGGVPRRRPRLAQPPDGQLAFALPQADGEGALDVGVRQIAHHQPRRALTGVFVPAARAAWAGCRRSCCRRKVGSSACSARARSPYSSQAAR